MKKRPLALTILAILHFLYPVYYTFQVMYYEHIPLEYLFPLLKILFNPFREFPFFFLSVSAIILAYGLLRVRLWAYWYFLIYALLTVVFNIYSYVQLAENDPIPPVLRFSAIIITFGIMYYFVQKHIRAPYFNPRLRWWETDQRYQVEDMTAKYRLIEESEMPYTEEEIFDLSVGGLFVSSNSTITLGTRLNVVFKLLGEVTIDCIGKVVWVSHGTKRHPQGFGIMFTEILNNDKRQIRSYLKSLSKELTR